MESSEKITHQFMPIVLRRNRDKAGLSQQQLADALGVSKGFISALEGGRSVPSIDRLLQVAEVLGVRASVLMEELVAEIRQAQNKQSKV